MSMNRRDVEPILISSRASIEDGGPTVNLHWVNVWYINLGERNILGGNEKFNDYALNNNRSGR